MKNFILKILLFLIPVFLYVGYCEYFLRNMPSQYRQKRDQLIENSDSIQVLILGSSHAQDGVDPETFSLYAHNMAFGSQSIYFDKKITEKYLPQLPKLKYVLLTFDYNSLFFDHEPSRDFFYYYYYGIPYRNHNFWRESLLQYSTVYPPRQALSIIVQNKFVSPVRLKKGYPEFRSSDINPEDVTSPVLNKMRADMFNRTAENIEIRDDVLLDLESLIAYLIDKDIVPILVTYPAYTTFRDFLNKEIVENNNQIADYLQQKYPILYLNYFEDNDFSVADYFNCDHLSSLGAVKLSKKIDAEINKIEQKRN